MALNRLRIPNLQSGQRIVDANGVPTNEFFRRLNDIFQGIGNAVNSVIDAENAAQQAQAAAAQAVAAAEQAQEAGETNSYEQALRDSGPSPTSVLSATVTTITIQPHQRVYGNGTTVSLNGGSISTVAAQGAANYVYYDQPSRAGGAVTYMASTSQQVQGNDRHVVGAVTTPTTGTQNGGNGPQFPGQVEP